MARRSRGVLGWRVATCCAASAGLSLPSSAQPWPGEEAFHPTVTAVEARFETLALSPDGALAAGFETPQAVRRWGEGLGQDAVEQGKSVLVLWDARTRRATRRFGAYDGSVRRASFSRDGRMLAVQGLMKSPPGEMGDHGINDQSFRYVIEVWDVARGVRLCALKRPVERVANGSTGLGNPTFLPDGTLLTVGMYGSLPPRLWDARTGALKRTLPAMPEVPVLMVNAVAASPDGRFLAIGGGVHDGTVASQAKRTVGRATIYDLQSGRIVRNVGEALPEAASLPPARGVVRRAQSVPPGPDGNPLGPERNAPGGDIYALAFSPDGRRLATGGARVVLEPINEASYRFQILGGDVRLWDVESGKLERALPAQQAGVEHLAFSPDGRRLAGADRDSVVSVWDVEDGAPLHQWRARGRWLSSRSVETKAGPKGQLVEETFVQTLSTAGWVGEMPPGTPSFSKASALPNLEQEGQTITTRVVEEAVESGVQQLVFSPDGARLTALNLSRSVFSWGLLQPAPNDALRKYLATGGEGPMRTFAFSPDGSLVASGGSDKRIRIWDVARREQILSWPAHTESVGALAWTPDGRSIVSSGPTIKWTWTDHGGGNKSGRGDTTGSEIRVWDRAEGTLRRAWTVGGDDMVSLALSPDGKTLYSAGNFIGDPNVAPQEVRGTLRWWGLEEALNGKGEVAPRHSQAIQDALVRSLAVSPDGATLATDHERQGLRLWDAQSGDLRQALDTPEPGAFDVHFGHPEARSLTFAPNGRVLRAAGKAIQSWNARSGERGADIDLPEAPTGLALSPDGRRLAVSAWGGMSLWDAASGQKLPWPETAGTPGWGVGSGPFAFSPDGAILANASSGPIELWNVATK